MAIDPKRLQRDARTLKKARRSHEGDSTMAAIRAVLPVIHELRTDGVRWSDIAAALGEQGLMQGKGKHRIPITTNRLTSLVTQIERAVKVKERPKPRAPDQAQKINALQNRRASLALELTTEVDAGDPKDRPTEEDLRRAALDRIRSVLKKD
ncbi:hypothetical protein [Bradyrhizobium cenepequi]